MSIDWPSQALVWRYYLNRLSGQGCHFNMAKQTIINFSLEKQIPPPPQPTNRLEMGSSAALPLQIVPTWSRPIVVTFQSPLV